MVQRWQVGPVVLLLAILCNQTTSGDEPPDRAGDRPPGSPEPHAPPDFDASSLGPEALLADWIAAAIPDLYEKQEDWGKTTRVTVGLETRTRGLRVRVRRKKKDVPHGVWKHYRIAMRDIPDALQVEVDALRAVAPGRAAATVHVSAPLDTWARTRIYQYGVHLGTYTAEARTRLVVTLDCELGVRLDVEEGWPVLILDPAVRTARLDLHEFRLTRVSNANGPLVHELGRAVRHVIEDELEPRKLTKKLNRSIDKKRHKLRLGGQDLVAGKWGDLVKIANSSDDHEVP